MIEALTLKFGIPGKIEFKRGHGDFVTAVLRVDNENSLEAVVFGAQILSWRSGGQERLFLSNRSIFDGKKAIRGGIPLVFPQFGSGEMPSHGFARIVSWEIIQACQNSDGSLSVIFGLAANDETKKYWKADFEAELECRLADTLVTTLRVKNKGDSSIEFQNAFHTYFLVSDSAQTAVEGLRDRPFLDNTNNRAQGFEERPTITFSSETDRIYQQAPETIRIVDPEQTITIESVGCKDAVVWNPWNARCAQIGDLEPEDFRRYVCVEPGNICEKLSLASGDGWECSQTISYSFGS